jgi:hypothetical protein
VPASLRLLAQRRDLQRRIRSATACYLDLGDFQAPTTANGGYLPDDWPPLPQPLPTDGSVVNLDVCADSFAEFLCRFWIENEIWYALHEGRTPAQKAASYRPDPRHFTHTDTGSTVCCRSAHRVTEDQ